MADRRHCDAPGCDQSTDLATARYHALSTKYHAAALQYYCSWGCVLAVVDVRAAEERARHTQQAAWDAMTEEQT